MDQPNHSIVSGGARPSIQAGHCQVIMSARQVSLVSGRSVYVMDDHSRISILANEILHMYKLRLVQIGGPNHLSCFFNCFSLWSSTNTYTIKEATSFPNKYLPESVSQQPDKTFPTQKYGVLLQQYIHIYVFAMLNKTEINHTITVYKGDITE